MGHKNFDQSASPWKSFRFLRTRPFPSKLSRLPESGSSVAAIVKVSEDGYVPDDVDVRARIGERIFTAILSPSQLKRLDGDRRVISVEPSHRLRTFES
jgi:hypothetical protein